MSEIPRRFGPYEIVAQLGAGGMGQVFRARDSRLQRDVAIKVLSGSGALSPDRQRRFAQEAVAASALNHPNILTVYDVGVEGDIPYLVAELIEGESLRAEMQLGRLSLRRTLDIGYQIASGLAAAHEAGINHRDLKPENVMITRDRRAKIVDFGLAKAATDEEDTVPGANAQTQTAAGLIVGTVPYMSPEQARGGRSDFRSDQFALGVMLFEMTTATHPFRRETSVQTLSAIIADEPPDISTLSPSLAAPVRWLIRRLLSKDPRERFASTTDLAVDLRVLRDGLAELPPATDGRVDAPRRWLPFAAAEALVAAAFVAGQALASGGDGPSFDRYTPLATDAGYQGSPAWSPDGKTLAYVAEINGVVQVFTRRLESQLRTQITSSAFDCHDPFWSPDGTRIYYHSQARDRDALWYVSPVGGAPEVVIEGATMSAISPDAKTIATLREESQATVSTSLWFSSPAGAEPQRYAQGALKGLTFSNGVLRFAPDGSKLMAWLWRDASNTGPTTRFWEIPLPAGEPRERLTALAGLRSLGFFSWFRDSRHIALVRSDGPTPGTHLWVADTLADKMWPLTATAGNENTPDVSPDGRTLAFTSEATDFDIVEVPLDGSPLRPFLSSTRNEFDPAFSPTSTQYAFVTDRTGSLQIWIRNEEGYLQQPLVTDQMFAGRTNSIGSLAFSPDGQRLAFQLFSVDSESRSGGPRIWFASIAGGTPVALGGEAGYQDAPTWSPDGEWIAYVAGKIGDWSLVKSRIGAGNARPVVLKTGIPPYLARPQWSPDGKWIVCETLDGLAVVSADGKQSAIVAGPEWMAYAWSPDSRSIYGLHPTDDLHHFMFVSLDVASGKERVINPNLGILPPANQPIRGLTRLRDRGFLTSIARVRSDIYVIEGLRAPRHWWQRWWPFGRPAGN